MGKKIFPFIWFFKKFTGNNFFEVSKVKEVLTTKSTPWQTEGIDYISHTRMFLTCESTPEIPASLYTIHLQLDY